MKKLCIIPALFFVLSCSSLNYNWQQNFKNKADIALLKGDYFDANFYLLELAMHSEKYKEYARQQLMNFSSEPSMPNYICNDEQQVMDVYLKSKTIFLPIYHHSGTFESHIKKLKLLLVCQF